jgi:hypothetical protein|tara:strand:+ start:896 stop:1225 length:330 start_codon:yes stop_codon:yes gene_type:complete
MNNSWKTRYKKVANLKADDYRQVGQWVKNPLNPHLSKLLVKHGEKPVYLHGEKVQARFNKCYEAKKRNVMLPQEPQQVRMVVDQISTNKLVALKGICEFEINSRRAEQI